MEQASEQPRAFSLRDRVIPIFALTMVVALLALLAWAVFGSRSPTVEQSGRISATGLFVSIKNRSAPDFSVTDFAGNTLSMEELRGKTVILNFWASWCPPCKEEAKYFAELDRTLDKDKVAVVGIAVWDKSSDSKAFLDTYNLSYPNAADTNGSIAIDYGVAGVPETYIIGPDGQLKGKYPGAITSAQQVRDVLQELNLGS